MAVGLDVAAGVVGMQVEDVGDVTGYVYRNPIGKLECMIYRRDALLAVTAPRLRHAAQRQHAAVRAAARDRRRRPAARVLRGLQARAARPAARVLRRRGGSARCSSCSRRSSPPARRDAGAFAERLARAMARTPQRRLRHQDDVELHRRTCWRLASCRVRRPADAERARRCSADVRYVHVRGATRSPRRSRCGARSRPSAWRGGDRRRQSRARLLVRGHRPPRPPARAPRRGVGAWFDASGIEPLPASATRTLARGPAARVQRALELHRLGDQAPPSRRRRCAASPARSRRSGPSATRPRAAQVTATRRTHARSRSCARSRPRRST